MYVKNKMTANPYTIAYNASINDLLELMRTKNLKRVPVVKGEEVVGIVTDGDLHKVSPTKATSLSIYEVNYILSKLTVKDAMTKNVITISPDALLEEAAVLMRENRISTLAVVKDKKLVGIITESDIFDAFIDILGSREVGSRITIESLDVPGALANITEIFRDYDSNITHIVAFKGSADKRDIVIRTNTINTEAIEQKLAENGYPIKHVMRNLL